MNTPVHLRISSIASKAIMALAGLFLVLFLLVHLGINLLLLVDDGGRAFSAAASFMATNPVIRVAEPVLMGTFLLHMLFGVIVTIRNRAARPQHYHYRNRSETSPFSKYMMHTGIIVFGFLALHFVNFYFVKIGLVAPPSGVEHHDFYTMSMLLFSNPLYSAIYILSFPFLGFHLNHAIQSAFQTLGLNHSRYTPAIKVAGTLYAVLVTLGFMSIPFSILLLK